MTAESRLDALDRAIVNRLQDGLPIAARPYAAVAAELGVAEAVLLDRLQDLLARGVLSRFGPMYNAEAMGVPEDRFEEVAATVNAFPEVAHNYARAHALNMWFVLASEAPGRIAATIAEIETATGLQVYDMPKQAEFFVGLRLEA